MPSNLNNWTHKDVVYFLEQHFFVLVNIKDSHHYFRGQVDKKQKLTFIQKHSKKTIPPKSLEATIYKSGIPAKCWKEWANAGSAKARKVIQYPGAEKY